MGLREWLVRRRRRAVLDNCNHEMARLLFARMFSGGVIRKELAALLDGYTVAPDAESAWRLVLYDPKLLAVFEFARYGGFTERIFEDRMRRGLPVDAFPSDITTHEVDDAARRLRIELYMAQDRAHCSQADGEGLGMDKDEGLREIQRMHETETIRPESIIGWYHWYSDKLPRMHPERSKVDLVRTAALWMELTDRGGAPAFPYTYRSELGVSGADAPVERHNYGWLLGAGLIALGIVVLFVKPLAGLILVLAGPLAWYIAYRLGGGSANPDLLLSQECQRVLKWAEEQTRPPLGQ